MQVTDLHRRSYRLRSHTRQQQQQQAGMPGAVGQQRVARGRDGDLW